MATRTEPRTAWWDANGDLIELESGRAPDGKWVPKHDAALATLLGGPAGGRGAVCIRGRKPPAIVGKRVGTSEVTGGPVIAWYRRDDGPPKLTYRIMYVSPNWPAGGAA